MGSRTVITHSVNTVGGIIPTGTNDQTIPLNGLSSVNVGTTLNIKSILIGLILAIIGVSNLKSSFIAGFLLLVLGVAFVCNGIITYITFNRGGSPFTLFAAFYSKKALLEIKPVIDQALVANQAQNDLSMYFDKK